jgi:hypothetical protein
MKSKVKDRLMKSELPMVKDSKQICDFNDYDADMPMKEDFLTMHNL